MDTNTRVQGANFDEVLIADDTICISHDNKVMNKFLSAIEEVGKESGMGLNKGKREVIKFGGRARVISKIKRQSEKSTRLNTWDVYSTKTITPRQKYEGESEMPWAR